MRAEDIYAAALKADVLLYLKQGELAYKVAKGRLPEELRRLVAAHKGQLIDYLRRLRSAESGSRPEPLADRNNLPVSRAQRRVWLAELSSQDGAHFNIQGCYRFTGELDIGCFKLALRHLMQRHEALRANFEERNGDLRQVLREDCQAGFVMIDLDVLPAPARPSAVKKIIDDDLHQRFDLSRDALFRVNLIRLGPDRHVAIFNLHHIVADGWSAGLLIEEFCRAYTAYLRTQPIEEAPLPFQYADYAAWQESRLQGAGLEHGLHFWNSYLENLPQVHGLPLDKARPPHQRFDGDLLQSTISPSLERRIRAYCQGRRVSLFMFLETALVLLLAHYGDQADIAIGTPVAGRVHPESESLVGLFINTVLIRTKVARDIDFETLLGINRDNILAVFDHQHVPFELLVERHAQQRSRSFHPLFQIWFVLQNNRVVQFALPGCQVDSCPDLPTPAAKYDLNIYAQEGCDGIRLDWVFNIELFDRHSIACVAQQFTTLLERIIESPRKNCFDYGIFAPQVPALVPPASCIADLCSDGSGLVDRLRKQMQRRTTAAALVCNGHAHSYARLADLARGYAGAILRSGSQARIGLLLERGIEMVAAMLAALQLGRTYVPLDPAYPSARLSYMLTHADCDLIITSREHFALVDSFTGSFAIIDQPGAVPADDVLADGTSPAYILYTSGSTGHPKGVTQDLAGLAYHAAGYAQGLGLCEDDRVLQLASYSFDASVLDTYGTLLTGGTLYLADPRALAPASLLQLIIQEKISVYHSTPTVFKYLFAGVVPGSLSSVRAIVLGGEAVDQQSLEIFRAAFGEGCRLVGLYGATESSLTTLGDISLADIDAGLRPVLGSPIAGTALILRRADGSEARVFEPAQVVIRSRHVARGYWREPLLSAQRFVRMDDGTVEYFSGDYGYRLPSGHIRFLGRGDFQCKLHGIRIELGEIECALCEMEDVARAAVVVQPAGEDHVGPRLVAYVQSRLVGEVAAVARTVQEQKVIDAYRAQLVRWLPDYMLPSHYVFMDTLPLTPSGKVDRLALPKAVTKAPRRSVQIAPQNRTELQLCELWKEVLEIADVGVNDNFFDVGGSSLLAMQLCKRVGERLSRNVSVIDLFTYPTIRTLARFIDAEDKVKPPQAEAERVMAAAEDIAIIGIACRFPDAQDAETFWRQIAAGHESICFYSEEQLLHAGMDPAVVRKPNFVPSRTLLPGCEDFDASYFALTGREAEVTDPQQRILLECAHEVLESAGHGDGEVPRNVGVFVGVGMNQYFLKHLLPQMEEFSALGEDLVHANNKEHHAATRISYKLNLCGPSLSLNTACSTSLVAVHEACKSLLHGECRMAIAGGANIVEFEPGGYLYHEGDIRSPDGQCRTFDQKAGGTRRGNGAAVVLLKRLDAALADGDTIHAVVKGSSTSNDGADKVGYTAPSVLGQVAAIRHAQRKAGVNPSSIQYVETHGTGTPLGDPIELRALTLAFGDVPSGTCAIGSLKPNIGHLEVAAGIASLIKTVQALKHRLLPPHIHYDVPNPKIDFDNSPFYVNTQLKTWESSGPRRAGVSSFGLGGTNAHAVLEEAPPPSPSQTHRPLQLLLLSARTETALQAMSERLAVHLEQSDDTLADVAYTLQLGRARHACRRMLVCRDADDAVAQLKQPYSVVNRSAAPVMLVLGDQSMHANKAGQALYASEPEFCRYFDAAVAAAGGEILQQETRWFIVQYSLAKLLMSWGVQPAALVGRGRGEWVAACLAGVFSLEHALTLVDMRALLVGRSCSGDVIDKWRRALEAVPRQAPSLPCILSRAGGQVDEHDVTSVHYWMRHLAGTDSGAEDLAAHLPQADAQIWLEVGAWEGVSPVRESIHALPAVNEPAENEPLQLQQALGQLWLAGVSIDWNRYQSEQRCRRVPLPTYPFERRRYWVDPPMRRAKSTSSAIVPAPVQVEHATSSDGVEQWLLEIWRELMGNDSIDVHGDFFEMGGNSLLATRILSRLRERFPFLGTRYSISTFFESPTIAGTAEKINAVLAAAMVERQQAVLAGGNATMDGVL